ncbi:MAG: TlpA family protein disulfide reductase [Nocardioides sp.]
MRLLAVLLAAVLLGGGCGTESGVPAPGPADVDVDTAELRAAKDAAGVEPCPTDRRTPVDGGLPEVTVPCFGGGPDVDLASLRGPLVVNLWASWCGPCRQEMPVLQSFYEKYGDRVPVLGIDWQDPQSDAAMDLVRHTGVTYPLLADPETELSVVDGMPIRGLPGLILLDADGRIAYRNLETVDDEAQLVELVDEHLGIAL